MDYRIRVATVADLQETIDIDDSAAELYVVAGLPLTLTREDPFCQAEQQRWLDSIHAGRLFLAVETNDGQPEGRLGFAALGFADGAPYLDQLSVRLPAMRRGVGRHLLNHAVDWATGVGGGAPELWLTTYAHLPFNRPFYERAGFVVVPEAACGPELRHHLEEERRSLPLPDERVAMRRSL